MKNLFLGFLLVFIFSNQGLAAINRQPTANSASVSTDEDMSVSITFTGSDPEGAALTYSIVTYPNKGSLACSAHNQCVYTPITNINGSDRFSIRAYDGSAYSRLAWIQVTINAVNDAPTVTDVSYTHNEDYTATLRPSKNDVDGDALSVTFGYTGYQGNVSIVSGTRVIYTPIPPNPSLFP